MHKHSIQYKSSTINYYKYGVGKRILFCLHGYGEDGTSFSFLEEVIGKDFTFYAIDFPFHGETIWQENEPFTSNDVITIFNKIDTQKNEKFSLLAYSMGGRVAMYLMQIIPDKIEDVVLVAPDGLHVNFWYFISTRTRIGNKLFKNAMQHPKLFFGVLNFGSSTKLVNKSIIKFVHHFLDDATEREMLYKRWTAMQKFKPHLATIKKIAVEKNIQLRFLFGEYDRIILSKRAGIFSNTKNIHIQTIEAGHLLMKEKYTSYIAALLYD